MGDQEENLTMVHLPDSRSAHSSHWSRDRHLHTISGKDQIHQVERMYPLQHVTKGATKFI